MDSKIAHALGQGQKDRGPAFIALIQEILSRPDTSETPKDLRQVVEAVVSDESVGLVAGRQVLSGLVKILGDKTVKNTELYKGLVEGTLSIIQPRIVTYEEQVCSATAQITCHLSIYAYFT
jgi:COP9 signalosome complex subunit 4